MTATTSNGDATMKTPQYACMHTIPAIGGTKIEMVREGFFRLTRATPAARQQMKNHGYGYDRSAKLWS